MNTQDKSNNILIEETIPTKSKFAFGGATMASGILNGIAFGAITFYYNIKLGLSEEFIALAWLIFAAWNAVNDPLFGFIEDRTKSEKYGRRIPYLRFGAPIYGILFVLVWFPFANVNNEIALFINLVIILFAFDTLFTIIGLITYSLPAEMAISSTVRANLMVYGSIFGALGVLISFIIPVLLLTSDVSTEIDPTFLTTMVILGIVCAAVISISSFYIKENKYTILEEPLPIFKGIKQTFKNKPFLIFEISNFAFLISSTILITAVFYYITFVLKLSGLMAIIPILLFFIMVFAFTPIYAKLVSRYGLKKVYIFSLVFSGLGFLLFFFIGWVFITSIIALILVGIGFSGIFLTSQAVFAEIIDYDEILTEKRRETTYSGMNALLTKPAISIANGLFLLIIAFYGFQRASQAQTESAQMGIMIGFTIVPAIFILISALAMKFFSLDGPDWNKQKVELKKIHEEKEKEYLEYLKKHNKL